MGFCEPLCGLDLSAVVFAFDDDAAAFVVVDACYVSAVFCPGFGAAVYVVVVECVA